MFKKAGIEEGNQICRWKKSGQDEERDFLMVVGTGKEGGTCLRWRYPRWRSGWHALNSVAMVNG